jgi:hypothetical protein
VITFALGSDATDRANLSDSSGDQHIDPRQKLAVAVRAAAETLRGQLFQAVILGIIVAALPLARVDRAWSKRHEIGYDATVGA